FRLVPAQEIADALAARSLPDARTYAAAAAGRPGIAIALASDEAARAARRALEKEFYRLVGSGLTDRFAWAVELADSERDPQKRNVLLESRLVDWSELLRDAAIRAHGVERPLRPERASESARLADAIGPRELVDDAARLHILPTDSPLVQVDMPMGKVVRKATASDLFTMNKHKRMEEESSRAAQEMVRARSLPLKILGADWQFDGSSLVLFYSSEERVDLGELSDAFAAHFGTRIELRKMGARDETKVMTGVGTCGRELCCSSGLDKFSNISIRMAKEQD